LPSIANLKCTPSDRQMYPQGYMYPRFGTPEIDHRKTYQDTFRCWIYVTSCSQMSSP